jgi:4-amino-4-deoxy-L-arabinose transferase-like glycosyltransferase
LFKTHRTQLNSDLFWLIFFTLAAIFLWLLALGELPLRDWDEGYYATVSQDMFNHHQWLYPTYQGHPFWLKPPLLFWLIHLSYQWGGVNEWSSRLPSAIITALGVPLLYLIGRQLDSLEPATDRYRAIFSASVYLTLLPVVRLGRLAMLDGMINTFLLIAIFCLLKGFKSSRWLVGVGVGLGLISLSKGVLVIALGAILLSFILWEKRFKLLLNPYLLLGLLIGFLPALIWYFLQIHHYGQDFVKIHFFSQSFDRLSTAVEGNTGPFWFYLIELLKYAIPWLFFFIPGCILAVRSLSVSATSRSQTWAKLALVGSIGYLGIISLMTTKLPWYIMPFYIFFALITGNYLNHLKNSHLKYPSLLSYLLLLCTVIALGGWIYFTFVTQQISLILIAGALALTFGSSTFYFFQHQYRSILLLILGLYGTFCLLMLSPLWNWELNEAFAVKPVAQLIKSQTPADTIIYSSMPYSRTSLDFYSDRQILAVDEKAIQDLSHKSGYLLLDSANLAKISDQNYQNLGKSGEFVLIKTHP